jgi:hypothetical protein
MDEPFIQILLNHLSALIEIFPEGNVEKLIQYGPGEAFNKTIGLGRFHLRPAALNVFRANTVQRYDSPSAEFPSVVGQDSPNG